MSQDENTPAATPAPAAPRSRTRRALRVAGWSLGTLVLLLALLLAGLWWWLGTSQSLATALTQAARYMPAGQTLTSREVSGSLRAGGRIGWLRWESPTLAVEVSDARIAWSLPPLLDRKLRFGEVHAGRVQIEQRGTPSTEPTAPLQELTLPIEIDLPFSVDELQLPGEKPLRISGLAGRYQYTGGHHRLQVDGLDVADGHYSAQLDLQGAAPMALDAQVDGRVSAPLDETRRIEVLAKASAKGTLSGEAARLQVTADLNPAEPDADAPMQAHVSASLAPWLPQPVLAADADLKNVDLARLWPQAPVTLLSGTVHAGPGEGSEAAHWKIDADVRNTEAGPWDKTRLPVAGVNAHVDFDGQAWTISEGRIELGGGRIEAQGRWAPTPQPWQAQATVRGVQPAALHSRFAGGPINGKLSAEQKGTATVFDLLLQAEGGAGAKAAKDSLESLPLKRIAANGQWQDGQLTLRALKVEADRAQLEGSAQAQPAAEAGSAKLTLSAPGLHTVLDGRLAPDKGDGTLRLRVDDAALLQRWLTGLPGLGAALGDLTLAGQAQLDASWRGGWQAIARRLGAPDQPAAKAAEPTLQASVRVPRLDIGTGAAAEPIALRGVQADLAGSLAHATLDLKGEATLGQRRVNLETRGSGGLARAHQWTASLASLRLALAEVPTAPGRKVPAPWQLQLQQALNATVQLGSGTDAQLQVDASGGAAALSGPVEGTVRLEWQPVRFNQRTVGGKRSIRLQSKGQLRGLPLAWAEAFGQGGLREMGLSGDLSFDGDWDIDAGDALRAHVRVARASGDIRVQAGEAAMVTRIHSTGTGTATEITTDAGGTGPSTPAGLHRAEFILDAQGNNLRATLDWDSERAGNIKAEATTELVRRDGGWQWAADAPLGGHVQAQLPKLGVWSMLAPPGWRIGGTLNADATLSGNRAAPRWNGKLAADSLALRAAVEGLDLQDGVLRATLAGNRLTLDQFSLKGGAGSKVRIPGQSGNISTADSERAADGGSLDVRGDASWGEAGPDGSSGIRMAMQATIQRLRLLVRSDRQLAVSGKLDVALAQGQITVRGDVTADRAVIILPDETAPGLGSDVVIRSAAKDRAEAAKRARQTEKDDAKVTQAQTRKPPDVQVGFDLGKDFAVQGLGITTRLEGKLDVVSRGEAPRLTGEIHTVQGRYRAYGQQLDVESGVIRFNGPYDNPSLDVLALRPSIDYRAGVSITGTASSPRVKLYSEPQLSDAETLSWVVLGRASAANGGEAVLMQQAALALLGKVGGNASGGNLASKFGLDEIGFKGPSEGGDLAESTITVGKRLSKDFYVTYERSLAGTVGTLYIFYDLTQRLTLRGEAGEQYGADVIYTIKYD